MGTAITSLIIKKTISFGELRGKILIVDTHNILYQFLSSIRQRDGTLLMDSKGNVTSHLAGLFTRTTNLMKKSVKLAFVFDGKVPELKFAERERRRGIKQEAQKQYEIAKQRGDIEAMRKYASRLSKLTTKMIEESKLLISYLGLPVIQAPSEAEAQAAFIVSKGHAFACVSQDMDSLLFRATKLIRNLTVSRRRKIKGKSSYETIKPEIIKLSENLNNLGIDQDQLIVLAMLVGTDYNVGGVKGIGPKTALKLVKKHGKDFNNLFKEAKWSKSFDYPWKDVFSLIKKMPVTKNYNLEWKQPQPKKIFDLLVKEHDFSEKNVTKTLKFLRKQERAGKQKGLGEWF